MTKNSKNNFFSIRKKITPKKLNVANDINPNFLQYIMNED
jgi:hypothetical protein